MPFYSDQIITEFAVATILLLKYRKFPMSYTPFKRDTFTWLAYFMLAYFGYLHSSVGPLTNFLRVELNLNYAEGALHGSAYAIGMIVAGLVGSSVVRRWGRTVTFWGGGAGMALGALCLILGQSAAVTVASTFIMGVLGTLLLSTINSSLSDQHGEHRAIALTEANICASLSATLAPLLLGGLAGIGLGWRAAVVVAMVAWIGSVVIGQKIAIPAPQSLSETRKEAGGSQALPALFWMFWLLVFLSGAMEACLGFWGAAFLTQSAGLPLETASGLVSVMFAAMAIGRAVGSRLTRTTSVTNLLVITVVIISVGFPIFWLSPLPALNVVGLFIMGLGLANLFPLSLSAATGVAGAQADAATAYVSFGAGLSILLMPQLMGFIADQIGIHTAFLLLGVVVAAALMVVIGNARQVSMKRKNDLKTHAG